jgi:hypothetical protein
MPSNELALDAEKQSIQTLPDAKKQTGGMWGETLPLMFFGRMPFLPPWGSRRREVFLRALYRHELNTLFQGAIMGLSKKVVSAPFEISGPKSGTSYFQDVLRAAQFGQGWRELWMRALLDYFRHDIGGFIEVIGPGNPMRPIKGRITGLAHLDAMHCYLTGDPQFPVIYRDGKGKSHTLHKSRVIRLIDMPDGDESIPGPVGLCAMSRAAAIIQREILMNRYIEFSLDDKPKPGILLMRNLTEKKFEEAVLKYLHEQNQDDNGPFGKVIPLFGLQPEQPIEAESITFSEPPEKFDYRVYKVDIDVNEMALALGVDVQELWQLGSSGGQLGTSTQSEILNQKSRGKTFGDILKMIERSINDVLPLRYEFEFKWRDSQEDQEQATLASTWVGIANQLVELPPELRMRLLANQVEAIRDIVLDENGEIIRLGDADADEPSAEGVKPEAVSADDKTGVETSANGKKPPASQDDKKGAPKPAMKEWGGTRSAFVSLLMDAINAAREDELTRRRFGTVMRAHLRNSGLAAFRDGLQEAGVDAAEMDARDEAALAEWLRLQSAYVSKFADRVFSQGLSDAQTEAHAEMWANKSLRDAYQLGQASGAWNGMYLWKLGPTEEHCEDCARLDGQIHRMRDWRKKALRPGSEALACHGYNCLCTLTRTTARASGGF